MVFDMLEEIDNESMAKIVMMLWTIWWRKNQKCWNLYIKHGHRHGHLI
jgi:hypothetical protein